MSKYQKYQKSISIDDFFKLNLNPKFIQVHHNEFSLKHVLLHEFGLPLGATDEMVDKKIKEIDETFDLVMVVEHFDKSMVLLKNLLQWNFEDVSSLKLNTVPKNMKSKISNSTRTKMRKWFEADYKLYDHFKTKLERNLKHFGEFELDKELKKYHQVQNKIKEKCPIKTVPRESLPKEDRPWSLVSEAYKILSDDPECQMIGMQEPKFINLLRKEQNERISNLQDL